METQDIKLRRLSLFRRIRRELNPLTPEARVEYCATLDRAVYKEFQPQAIRVGEFETTVIFDHTVGYYIHNSTQPTGVPEGYFLFGYSFSQRDWFRALRIDQEEQLAHILKWGKHE